MLDNLGDYLWISSLCKLEIEETDNLKQSSRRPELKTDTKELVWLSNHLFKKNTKPEQYVCVLYYQMCVCACVNSYQLAMHKQADSEAEGKK